jgi:magnesium-transporting ATPase (P-type)
MHGTININKNLQFLYYFIIIIIIIIIIKNISNMQSEITVHMPLSLVRILLWHSLSSFQFSVILP